MAIHTMQKLGTLSLTITASDEFPDTKIAVTIDEEYSFTCDASQHWTDWYRKTGPDGFFNFFAWIAGLRVKGVKCFCLCGAYNDDYTKKGFPIGTEKTVTITENGSLSFFANDAPGHYGNNKGSVIMNIKRLS